MTPEQLAEMTGAEFAEYGKKILHALPFADNDAGLTETAAFIREQGRRLRLHGRRGSRERGPDDLQPVRLDRGRDRRSPRPRLLGGPQGPAATHRLEEEMSEKMTRATPAWVRRSRSRFVRRMRKYLVSEGFDRRPTIESQFRALRLERELYEFSTPPAAR